MTRADLTEKLLDIKREKGWTWKHICDQIGGMSPLLITGALLGQMKLTKPQAANAAKLFGLSKSEQAMLNEVPMRGTGTPMPPTDPLIYRFYELFMVNGPAIKALIEEEFGDGIMSAIDFDMEVTRKADPKGDRVAIGMTGKFLPYKYYGASGNSPPMVRRKIRRVVAGMRQVTGRRPQHEPISRHEIVGIAEMAGSYRARQPAGALVAVGFSFQ